MKKVIGDETISKKKSKNLRRVTFGATDVSNAYNLYDKYALGKRRDLKDCF